MQLRQQVARVPHVAAHGRVRPGALAVPEEPLVQLDELRDPVDLRVREPEGLQPLPRHLRADHVVVVEGHDAALLEPPGRRLPDVVQQRREPEHHVGRRTGEPLVLEVDRLLQHLEAVLVDVLVPVLPVAREAQRGQLRQHEVREAGVDEQLEALRRPVRGDELDELLPHALGGDDLDPGRERRHGADALVVEHEAELGGEAGGAEHAQRVLVERLDGGGRRGQPPVEDRGDPVGRVDDREGGEAHRDRVRREVAPAQVAVEGVAEHDLRLPRGRRVRVLPVRRDLDGVARDPRGDGAEGAAHVPHRRRDGLQDRGRLVRARGGREIEVGDGPVEQGVAHGAADQGDLVPGGGEGVDHAPDGLAFRERRQPRHGGGHRMHGSSLWNGRGVPRSGEAFRTLARMSEPLSRAPGTGR